MIVGEMVRHENDLLRERMEKREHTYRLTLLTVLLLGVAASAGVVAFMVLRRRHFAAPPPPSPRLPSRGSGCGSRSPASGMQSSRPIPRAASPT